MQVVGQGEALRRLPGPSIRLDSAYEILATPLLRAISRVRHPACLPIIDEAIRGLRDRAQRKIAEGKNTKMALRTLKRRITTTQ